MRLLVACALLAGCDATLSFEENVDTAFDAPFDAPIEVSDASDCVTHGCPLESLRCDTTTGKCEECIVDGDCPFFMVCDPATHKCWGCLDETDCPDGTTCITEARRCIRSCTTKEQCWPGSACDTSRSICIWCISNTSCFDPRRRRCNYATGRCEECLIDKDCPPMNPRCDPATFRCSVCLTHADCIPPKLCDPSRHWCVTPP